VNGKERDALAKALIDVGSRRRALGGMLAGALALLGPDRLPRSVAASPHGETTPFDSLATLADGDEIVPPAEQHAMRAKQRRRDGHQGRKRDGARSSRKNRGEKRAHTRNGRNESNNRDKARTKDREKAKDTSTDDGTSAATGSEIVSSDGFLTKTLLWTTLFSNSLTKANLDKIAAAHFNGFQIDVLHRGIFDDFLNGGVGRMSPTQYERLQTRVSGASKYARKLGMDSLFLRLNIANFDVYSEEDVDTMVQATRAQAQFARETGLTGLWLDAEDYWNFNLWNQAQNSGKQAYGRPEDEVRGRYREFGRQFMQAAVSKFPSAEILLAPSLHMSTLYPQYQNIADFYAGMAEGNVRNSIVITTELSYDHATEAELVSIVNNETQYLAPNSSVALGYWPRDESQTSVTALSEAVRLGRQYSPKYNWVYDEAGIFLQKTAHSCFWVGWDPAHSCLAKGLQDVLPPL
jgi:hypothetical protein